MPTCVMSLHTEPSLLYNFNGKLVVAGGSARVWCDPRKSSVKLARSQVHLVWLEKVRSVG